MKIFCKTYHEERDTEHCGFCSAICSQHPVVETTTGTGENPQFSNPRLVVAFDIIDKDRKPIIKECHNTVEVELAEDELSKSDYLFVLRELAGAVDRMASKGLATRLFYQRPVTTPGGKPYNPNRKGLVRDFEFLSYHSQIQASPQDGHTSPLTGPSH